MIGVRLAPGDLRPNPDWANLPIFDQRGWKRLPFGKFADSINERVEPADAAEEIYVGLEHLDPENLHIHRWGKGSDVIGTKLRFRKGDIIFGRRRAYQRKLAVAEFDGICSAHAMVVRAKPEVVLPEFLPFLMMSDRFMNRAVEISVGSLSPTINWKTLKNEEFDIPPLEQQRRIAEILWAVDETKDAWKQNIVAVRSFQMAFWNGHISRANVKIVPISEVADVANGSTPSKSEDKFWQDGTIPWLPTGKVHDRFIQCADDYITEAALKARKARIFPRGSVLVAMIGQGKTRGMAALLEMDASINQNFACIIPRAIESQYLFYALDFNYEKLRRSAHGSNQEALNCGLVADFPIPITSPAEQKEVGAKLRYCEDVQKHLKSHAAQMHHVLTELIRHWFP